MDDRQLREWGARWYPLTTNIQSLRWLYEFPVRMRELQDRLWEQQKGTSHVAH